MDKAIKDFIDNLWIYNYKIRFFDNLEQMYLSYAGVVLANSWEDAYQKVKSYYIDKESGIDKLTIEARDIGTGEINANYLVIEDERII